MAGAQRVQVVSARSKALQRLRSERVERSFAHTCGSGCARRTWLRGVEDIKKRYVIHAAARNLGTIMRKMFGVGTPRALQRGLKGLVGIGYALHSSIRSETARWVAVIAVFFRPDDRFERRECLRSIRFQIIASSTAC